jgi:ureidoglycolate hydrolase
MLTVNIGDAHISVTAEPLSQEAFAPFGDVITNPRPDVHPSAFASQPKDSMPSNAVSANQGTAIQYLAVSHIHNLYSQAPSGQGQPKMTMFVCATRELDPSSLGAASQGQFKVRLLERHPFTTQTFTPLSSSASTYLVIVAPSLQPSAADKDLPTPSGDDLPGRGLPDIHRLKAFVATSNQAVTYGAGTWHAPMVVLGKQGAALDFVVYQFGSGHGIEDCQLVAFESEQKQEPRIAVEVPWPKPKQKL